MQKNSLYKNSLYFILYRVINVIYPLVTATYVSRVLKPDGVGQISIAQTVVIFLTACACLGIPNYGTREVSKVDNRDELSKLFSELFITNLLSTAIFAALFYSIIPLLSNDLEINKTLYYVEGIILVLNFINVDWFYQGKEEFRYITIRSCIVKFLSIFAIFGFVKNEGDIVVYAIVFVIAYAGNYLFNVINLRKYVYFTLRGITPKKHIKLVLILAITYISNEIYVTVDTVMLGFMSGNSAAAYYSNAMKLIKILVNVCTAMGTALLPRLSRVLYDGDSLGFERITKKAVHVLMWITLACVTGIILTSQHLIIVLFGYDFAPSIGIIRVLCFLIVFRSFSNLFLQILLCTNQEKITTYGYFSGMILNIILNYFFIPYWGGEGAAIASVLSELYICLFLFFFLRKKTKIKVDPKYLASLAISLTCMVICVQTTKIWAFSHFMSLAIEIAIGFLSFVFVNMISKNEVLYLFLKKYGGSSK